jgi:trigger factor
MNLLEFEYKDVLKQILEEIQRIGKEITPKILEECRKLAERRVRVGFVIAEIARKDEMTASNEEIWSAVGKIARLYPGREREIYNAYSRGGAAKAMIGPILESKVINKLLDLVKVQEKSCTVQELIAIDEEPFDFLVENESSAAKDEATTEKTDAAAKSTKRTADTPQKNEVKKDAKPKARKKKAEAKAI